MSKIESFDNIWDAIADTAGATLSCDKTLQIFLVEI